MRVALDINDAYSPSIEAARLAYNAKLPPVTTDANGVPLPPGQTLPHPSTAVNGEAFVQLQVQDLVKSWLQTYGVLPPAVVVDGVPQKVSARQAYEELIAQGLHNDEDPAQSLILQCIAAIPDPAMRSKVRNLWNKSTEFQRDQPELILLWTGAAPYGLAKGLGDLDQTFINAAVR